MSELKRALTQAADDLANALVDELSRRDQDVQKVAEAIDLYSLAQEIGLDDLANEIDLDEVVSCLDADEIASRIDLDEVGACIDHRQVAQEIDLDDLAQRMVKEMDDRKPSLADQAARISRLEDMMAQVGDHLSILAVNLQGDTTATWEATATTMGEAAGLVPDNRVDGNGIRVADLEAVEDELAGN